MIKNYLKTAWRNLIRNKSFSIINISGLALGITCSLLIVLWVTDERKMDAFHTNSDYLYQVIERNSFDGKTEASYLTQGLLAEELKRVIPEVQFAAALESNTNANFVAGNKTGKMDGSFAGADFFKMFSYPVLHGTAANALSNPGSIAISRKMAEYFFNSADQAIGKTISYVNGDNLLVSAVFENTPVNSSQQFDFLRTWKDYVNQNAWTTGWSSTSPATLVQLQKDADLTKVQSRIKDFIHLYRPKIAGSHTELELQPYNEKYLHSSFKDGYIDGGRIEYVRLFTLVAIFILVIACINFMNLATARAGKRAKEVGVRKAIGAVRSVLIGQFVSEAILITFIAAIIALVLTVAILPVFNTLTGKQLLVPFSNPLFWLSLSGLLIITGFIAGSYPALFLSSLKPVRVLKGTLRFGKGALIFRKGLVVFQFALSIILMISMVVIYRQMAYTQSKNLGYDRDNLIYLPVEGELIRNYAFFKEQANKLAGITNVSIMKETPTVIGHHKGDVEWQGKDPNLITSFSDAAVGYDFVKTLKLKIKEGRDFDKAFGMDSLGFIVNETAVKKIGYKDPIGQPLSLGNRKGTIIGVVEDFHFNSMHQAIEPLIIRLDESPAWGSILVRTAPGQTKQAIAGLQTLTKETNPKFPFTYEFSDQAYAKLYHSEEIVSKLTNGFAILAIVISCLGLFGLAMFTASQRVKEIGVRKVLGATVQDIVVLLSANFLKPVVIAMLVAFPVAGLIMNQWLQDFAYKINIEWWIYALAGLATVVIALLTVSFESVKSALTNPVKNLRSE
ncbi:MAG TPA: ABC transporter permease [Flavitalea sp.]|nr:ABC transporter permease [Flavitalea sp.]